MKKLIYIFAFLALALGFYGCEYVYAPNNYYVSLYNDESDKYITAVYYRCDCYGGDRWSRNIIGGYIYPYEYYDIVLEEGVYDFRAIMEDDYYSYTVSIYSVYVYENIYLDICYDCYDKNTKVEITRTPKEKKNND